MEKSVIIVAAGKGLRMGSEMPKQFLPLAGRPLLMHTIEKFYAYRNDIQIFLVLSPEHIQLWQDLCETHQFQISHQIVEGGAERQFSVKNALALIPENTLIAVHDGVRPFVSLSVIENTFAAAEKFQSAIPVVPPVDTIRQITDSGSQNLDRNHLRLVQTPQCFVSNVLKQAYDSIQPNEIFTDDAGLVESKLGISPHLVEGNAENIKITLKKDFLFAEVILEEN